jgi:hypothetical protein
MNKGVGANGMGVVLSPLIIPHVLKVGGLSPKPLVAGSLSISLFLARSLSVTEFANDIGHTFL